MIQECGEDGCWHKVTRPIANKVQQKKKQSAPLAGKVYSRQATESVNCENSSVSFVMKYCPTSTVVRNPASLQNLLNLSCCDNFSIRSLNLRKRYYSCAGSSFTGMFVFITFGTNDESDCPFTMGPPVLS